MFFVGEGKIKKAFFVSFGVMVLSAALSVFMWAFSRFVLIPLGLRTATIRVLAFLFLCSAVYFLIPVILKKVKHPIVEAIENHRAFLIVNSMMLGAVIQVMRGEFDIVNSFLWAVKGSAFFMAACMAFAGMMYKIEQNSYKQFLSEFYLKFLTALLMSVACAGFWTVG